MLAPGPPLAFQSSLNVIKEYSSRRYADWVVIDLVAHNNDPSSKQPGQLLYMWSLQDVLLLLCCSYFPFQLFD